MIIQASLPFASCRQATGVVFEITGAFIPVRKATQSAVVAGTARLPARFFLRAGADAETLVSPRLGHTLVASIAWIHWTAFTRSVDTHRFGIGAKTYQPNLAGVVFVAHLSRIARFLTGAAIASQSRTAFAGVTAIIAQRGRCWDAVIGGVTAAEAIQTRITVAAHLALQSADHTCTGIFRHPLIPYTHHSRVTGMIFEAGLILGARRRTAAECRIGTNATVEGARESRTAGVRFTNTALGAV